MAGFLILFFVIFLFTVAMHRQTLDEHTRLINDLHKQLKALRQEVERLKSAPPVTPVEQTTTQHTPLSHTLTNTQKTAHPAPTITSAPTIPTTPSQEFNKPLATELMTAKQTHANAASTQEHATVNAQKHSASSVNPVQVNRQKLKKHQFPLKNKNTHHTPSSAQTTPSSAQTLLHSIWTWFSTGNPMLKIGVAILFLGLAFLLRFASDYIDTPLWLRYLAVGLSGLGATGAGIYLAQKRREYGLILQGFGLAVMYLTILAALKLPQLITPSTAFVLMLMAVIGKIILALRQDAKILAQIALIGGLATPILTSSGGNHYVVLFTYLALLNTGIAIIAQFKTWRSLNAMSLLGTFAIAFLWQEQLSTVQLAQARLASVLFGVYLVGLYAYVACLYAHLQLQHTQSTPSLPNQASLKQIYHQYQQFGLQVGILDSSVLFGSALAGFLFLYVATKGWFDYVSLYLSWGLAVLYGGFAFAVAKSLPTNNPLSQALWLLVGGFVSLGIGLAFDDELAVGLWALQACLVYVFGLKQQAPMARCFALIVLVCSSVLWFDDYQTWLQAQDHILRGNRYGTLWLVLAGALVYGLWQDWQGREYSAKWEIKTQQIALAFTLIHAMILPSLWFGVFATTWLLIIALVGLGVWLYRAANTVVALFVPIITVWTLCYFFINQSSAYDIKLIVLGLAASGAILTAAFGLHLPSWQNPHKKLPSTYFILGLFALLISLITLIDTFSLQIKHSFDLDLQFNLTWAMFLSFAVFALAFHIVKCLMGRHWQSLASVNLSFMVMISMMLVSLTHNHHTTAHIVLLGVVSLVLSLWILAEQRLSPSTANWVHCVHLGLVLGVASYLFGQSLNASVAYLWGIASLMLWAGLVYVPFTWKTAFVQTYQQWGQLLCMLIASIWLLDVAISTPIVIGTRLPLLNATDIMTVLLAVLWYHSIQNTQLATSKPMLMMAGAGLGLITISSIVMRTWHFYSDIAWNFSSLVADFGVQASLSLVWSAIGIGVMVIANKQQARTLWIAGASLVGVVVIKLFLIDLGNSGGVARIVSFIGVGLGLLLVGWFAPVPPKTDDEE